MTLCIKSHARSVRFLSIAHLCFPGSQICDTCLMVCFFYFQILTFRFHVSSLPCSATHQNRINGCPLSAHSICIIRRSSSFLPIRAKHTHVLLESPLSSLMI